MLAAPAKRKWGLRSRTVRTARGTRVISSFLTYDVRLSEAYTSDAHTSPPNYIRCVAMDNTRGPNGEQTVQWVQSLTPQQLKTLRVSAERGHAPSQCKLGRAGIENKHGSRANAWLVPRHTRTRGSVSLSLYQEQALATRPTLVSSSSSSERLYQHAP
jgi:hypothetical protein